MKTPWHYLFAVCFLFLTFSCKKEEIVSIEPPKSKQTDHSANAAVDRALENVDDIINNGIGGGSNTSFRISAYNLPCGVVKLDSTQTNSNGRKIYKIQYGSQSPCGYRKVKINGDVSFQLQNGVFFKDAGAVYTITFNDYKVQVAATEDIVTVNGTITVTNVDGGYIWQAITESKTIRHKIRGTLKITYANNEVRSRNYFQQRIWASSSGWTGLTFTVTGDTLVNNIKVSETGKTLDGNYDFKTEILSDFTWSNCGNNYAGPYVLKNGLGRMNCTIPNITPAYFEVEAGYFVDYTNGKKDGSKVNDCSSNAYKITLTLGANSNETFQLY